MSEDLVISGVTGTIQILGTFDDGTAYIQSMYGETYDTWLALDSADSNKLQKRTFAAANRFINQIEWNEDADTFEKRDAIQAFKDASYELAAMIAADPDVITLADQSNNIASLGAGGAFINYANPTSVRAGSAKLLPPILMRLIGQYLGAGDTTGIDGGSGQSGSCSSPMSDCCDLDPRGPY